jgi:Ca2+:H+ antiporter
MLRGLLIFIPVSLVLAYWVHAAPLWIFITGTLAIIPLADGTRRATEGLASWTGPSIGGLLNVTFGSIAELILALFVLATGDTATVKAQITGSIIGASLLGLGLSAFFGGWKREKQVFKHERAGLLGSLLTLTVIALLLPAFFSYTEGHKTSAANLGSLDEKLSLCVSVILILVYLANLIYTLVTHRDVFSSSQSGQSSRQPVWKSLGLLLAATALIAVESDLVAESLQATAAHIGISPFFLGITVLALIGNAGELISAVYFARQDRIGLSVGICVGSAVQTSLLLAPLLVLISSLMAHPMNLVFTNPLELIAIVGAVFAVNAIAADAETTWFEGVLLIAVYCLFAFAFFFVTP